MWIYIRVGLGVQAEPQKIEFRKRLAENTFFLAQKIDHLKNNRPEKSLLKKSAQIGGYNPPKMLIMMITIIIMILTIVIIIIVVIIIIIIIIIMLGGGALPPLLPPYWPAGNSRALRPFGC